jgi:hypothetical protein
MRGSSFGLRKGVLARKVFPLFWLLCLVAGAAFFTGCDLDGDDESTGFIPVGEWTDSTGGGYDISDTEIRYYTPAYGTPGASDYWPPSELKGNIINAVNFSEVSGVLIIKVTGTPSTGNTAGKYTGVYYKDYTSAHIFLANPIDPDTYAPIESDTLNEALDTFTDGNMGTYVTYWGSGYGK